MDEKMNWEGYNKARKEVTEDILKTLSDQKKTINSLIAAAVKATKKAKSNFDKSFKSMKVTKIVSSMPDKGVFKTISDQADDIKKEVEGIIEKIDKVREFESNKNETKMKNTKGTSVETGSAGNDPWVEQNYQQNNVQWQ